MAIVINDNPGSYYSAHDDLLFVVYEATKANDTTTYPDYKYVADIYVDGVLVTRQKKDPNPTSKRGIFNIGSAVRSYVSASFNPAGVFMAQESGANEWYVKVTVKFGEEYNGTIYTNLTVDSDRFYFNHYNGRLIGTRTSLAAKLGLALSNRPYSNKVTLASGKSFIPFFPSVNPVPIEIKSYNHVNALVDTKNFSYVPSQATVSDPYKLQLYDVSPARINLLYPGLITDYIKYYTVQIGATSIYRFDIQCEPRYTNNTLHFLNQYGGFESFDFNKVSRKNINIEKKDFGKLGYTVSSLGIVSYNNSNNVYNEQKAVYSSQFTESLTLNSDILSDDEYTWLGELMDSPLVYLEQSGYFIPVTIASNNYDYRKQINDKLTNLTLTLSFGQIFNTQYR